VSGSFYLWPKKWSTEAYTLILRGQGFLNALKASCFITFVGTPINVCANAGLAYMLSKDDLVGGKLINRLVMFTMLFGAGMIPNFINIRNLGLINNWFANILPGACGAWTVMVMKSFFSELPQDLEEAAEVDGATPTQIFFRITLPLLKPTNLVEYLVAHVPTVQENQWRIGGNGIFWKVCCATDNLDFWMNSRELSLPVLMPTKQDGSFGIRLIVLHSKLFFLGNTF
jgi:putative aldouronate transport system permease protein